MDTRTFYDRISVAYDLVTDAGESACRDAGVRMLRVQPGERVLDVGCGTGRAMTFFATAAGPAGRVVGVDISAGMLAVARRTLERAAANASSVLGDARALCFLEAAFDAVFMSFTLELFEPADIPRVLAETHRVLRPAGRLGVVSMTDSESSNAMTDIYKWLHRHFPHFVDCRPIAVNDELERGGFRITDARPMSIWGLSVSAVTAVRQ